MIEPLFNTDYISPVGDYSLVKCDDNNYLLGFNFFNWELVDNWDELTEYVCVVDTFNSIIMENYNFSGERLEHTHKIIKELTFKEYSKLLNKIKLATELLK